MYDTKSIFFKVFLSAKSEAARKGKEGNRDKKGANKSHIRSMLTDDQATKVRHQTTNKNAGLFLNLTQAGAGSITTNNNPNNNSTAQHKHKAQTQHSTAQAQHKHSTAQEAQHSTALTSSSLKESITVPVES